MRKKEKEKKKAWHKLLSFSRLPTISVLHTSFQLTHSCHFRKIKNTSVQYVANWYFGH